MRGRRGNWRTQATPLAGRGLDTWQQHGRRGTAPSVFADVLEYGSGAVGEGEGVEEYGATTRRLTYAGESAGRLNPTPCASRLAMMADWARGGYMLYTECGWYGCAANVARSTWLLQM